jgi:hypothetical protein
MNKTVSLLTALLFTSTLAAAQLPASLHAYWGYGSYGMRDMKEFQQASRESMYFNAQVTDQFPAHFLYGLKYMFKSPIEDRYGIVAEMGSTGGRLAYADYSGTYQFDQLLRYKRLGVVVERHHPLPKGLTGWLGIEVSALRSTLILEEEIKLTKGGKSEDSYTFYAWGGSVQPTASLEKTVGRLSLGLQAGVCLNVNETFYLKGERKAKLINAHQNNEKVGPGWGGFRLGIKAGIPIGKSRQTDSHL